VAGVPANLAPWLLSFTGLAALFGGVTWVAARDELDGRPFWILGMASLAFAAALRGQAQASLAWGISLLLSGGLLFLISSRHRYLLVLAFLGCMGMSALPFTPSWQGVRLYAAPFTPSLLLFLLAQAALLAGYVRHTLQPGHPLSGVERWTWAIYPAGLALLPLAHFFVAWWGWSQAGYPPLAGSWPGVAALLLVGLVFTRTRKVTHQALPVVTFLREFFSMGWFYGLLWSVYHLLRRGISSINLILEGEGGFLWTLLLLTLLLSLLMQPGLGG